ncbi:YlxR family protein [Ruminococcaceae bacterium OttesenSCG-928-D13]|nr:YlxR family protein [Ruminococcaceae bacterium OttesenSCG-928-D13]
MPQKAQKKIPIRRCVGCGEGKPKKELVRVVRSSEGEISLDLTGRKAGRGAYLCRSAECLGKAEKKKALNRAFETAVPPEVYAALAAEIEQAGDEENDGDDG